MIPRTTIGVLAVLVGVGTTHAQFPESTASPNTAPTVAPPKEPLQPTVEAEAELRREVAELERRLADLKRQLDAKPAPADKKN